MDRVAWLSFGSEPDPRQAIEDILSRHNNLQVIVLDDAEHVPDIMLTSFLDRVQRILPNVSVIVTSRQLFNLPDVHTLPLPALRTQEAVTLLTELLHLASHDPDIAALAATLDNHPLALTIVAGLAKDRPIRDLIRELQARLYELEQQVPQKLESVIEVVRPRIVIATDALIDRLRKYPRDLYRLLPRSFEELVAALLEDMGWEVNLTKQTRDGGRDILAYLNSDLGRLLCLIEAKRYNPQRPVGVELVRNLYGTLCDEQANSALLVTTSYFTADAREFQKRHVYQIGLRDYHDVVTWINNYKRKKA